MGGGTGEEGRFLSDPDHFRKTPVVSRTIYYHLSSRKPPPQVYCWRWAELSDSCRQEVKTTGGNAFYLWGGGTRRFNEEERQTVKVIRFEIKKDEREEEKTRGSKNNCTKLLNLIKFKLLLLLPANSHQSLCL